MFCVLALLEPINAHASPMVSKSRKLMQFAEPSEEPPNFSIRVDLPDAAKAGASWFSEQSTGVKVAIGVGAAVVSEFDEFIFWCLIFIPIVSKC